MAKFIKKKPVEVEAEQWFPGVIIEGVKQHDPELVFSQDGEYYYVSGIGADAWLAVEPGHPQHGDILPFVFWKVPVGYHRLAIKEVALTNRYLSYMGLAELPSYATVGGEIVRPGDWIITDGEGKKETCKPSVFEANYEEVA